MDVEDLWRKLYSSDQLSIRVLTVDVDYVIQALIRYKHKEVKSNPNMGIESLKLSIDREPDPVDKHITKITFKLNERKPQVLPIIAIEAIEPE